MLVECVNESQSQKYFYFHNYKNIEHTNLLGLFVTSFDTYKRILLDNPYDEVTHINKNKQQSGVSLANRPI